MQNKIKRKKAPLLSSLAWGMYLGMAGISRRPGVDPVGVFQLLVVGEAGEVIRCVSDCASEGREEELYAFRGIV